MIHAAAEFVADKGIGRTSDAFCRTDAEFCAYFECAGTGSLSDVTQSSADHRRNTFRAAQPRRLSKFLGHIAGFFKEGPAEETDCRNFNEADTPNRQTSGAEALYEYVVDKGAGVVNIHTYPVF